MRTDQGIIIIAQGAKRYIDMSRNIAMSLRLSNPQLPLALVTDSHDPSLRNFYDIIIPVNNAFGAGYSQKLRIFEYSPFERTMFIDVDCLVIRNIDWLFGLFQGHSVSVIGRKVHAGPSIGTSVEQMKHRLGIDYLLSFNGGVYYFEKGPQAQKVFQDAVDLFNTRYNELGLVLFNGRPGDEPVMSLAMALHRMEPVDDSRKGMYTPVGQSGEFRMDALSGLCEFQKYDETVMPAIMHFGGGYPEAFHYRRERIKILLAYKTRMPAKLISGIVNLLYNPPYAVFVFLYRLAKLVFKGKRSRFRPVLPMFRFE